MVYGIPCSNCEKLYVGETGRKLKVRISEHQKDVEKKEKGVRTRSERAEDSNVYNKSAITDHVAETNHVPNFQKVKVLSRDDNDMRRKVRESIWIGKMDNINRDQGALPLPSIYNDLLPLIPLKGRGEGAQ